MKGCDLVPLTSQTRPKDVGRMTSLLCKLACAELGDGAVRLKGLVKSLNFPNNWKEFKMPTCPKCERKLTKNKTTMSYGCKRHGFVRKIKSPQHKLFNKPKENKL